MKWQDVTFKQYLEIAEIQQRNDSELNKILDTTAVINNVDVEDITISNFKDYTQEITFLNTDIPIVEIKDEYGEYTLQKEIESITMKQYIDFNNYAKQTDYVGVLSVFLIPKGKQYNEGYDIDKVREYILSMPCTDVLSIYSFFLIYSTVSMECLKESLRQQQQIILTKRKQRRRQKMKLIQIYRLYRRYVARLIYHIFKSWK